MSRTPTLRRRILQTAGIASLLMMAATAQAHDQWLLPSSTQVEATTNPQRPVYVTVDAAVSNQLFEFNHNALRIDGLSVVAPDGSAVTAENPHTDKLRSSFDIRLDKSGTYRVAVVNDMGFAQFTKDGQTQRVNGPFATLTSLIPAGASDVQTSRSQSRVETFVTAGNPTDIAPVGQGLEILPLQPVVDLVAGETARFKVLLDGAPLPNQTVTVVPGGSRFRGQLMDQSLTTDSEGVISVNWPMGGMYWMNASYPPRPASAETPPPAAMGGAPGQRPFTPGHRRSYSVTLEVAPF